MQVAAHIEQGTFALERILNLVYRGRSPELRVTPQPVTPMTVVTFPEDGLSLRILGFVNAVNIIPFQGLIMFIRRIVFLLLALSCTLAPAIWAQGQQPSTNNGRKVLRKVQPEYPFDAKRMNLGGTVRLVAIVAPNGSVQKVEPVGGSPLLLRSAESAVAQWKYEAGVESKETVEIHFTP